MGVPPKHPARVPAARASSTDWQLSSILAREIRWAFAGTVSV